MIVIHFSAFTVSAGASERLTYVNPFLTLQSFACWVGGFLPCTSRLLRKLSSFLAS